MLSSRSTPPTPGLPPRPPRRPSASGHAVGPLHGIPIAIKDLVEIEGEVAMGGTAAWRNRIAPHTATLMRKLMAAGMINLGKTHTVEFAYGGWGTNQHLGTPWNPWDASTHRTPGGSSSGSGVAVAARMAPWAIGTDTGGSVRIPAAWNGITGLKTTIGRISTFGVLPLSPTLDTPGPITRDVEDAALLLTVLQGADPRDKRTLGVHDVDPMPNLRRGVKGLRLGRLPGDERDGIDAEVLAAYDRSVDSLASLGAEIVDLALPARFADLGAINGRIMSAEAYAALSHLVDDNAQQLDQDVRPRVRAGAAISSKGLSHRAGRAGADEGVLQRRDRGRGRAADAHRGDARHSGGLDRSEHDAGDVHALGQFPRSLCGGGAERVYRGRIADLAADHLPGLCRAVGAADRLRLSVGTRVASSGSAHGGIGLAERYDAGWFLIELRIAP